ncbi:MAG: serine--tRNA ligase [Brevinematales bacterium]|nr:serine--tRNA ligase [Brevinematales bacterium]
MHDLKFLTENIELVREKLKYRLKNPEYLDKIVELYQKKRELQKEGDDLRNKKKNLSKEIGIKKSKKEDVSDLMKEAETIQSKLDEVEKNEKDVEEKLTSFALLIPNIPLDDVPDGADETYNVEVRRWGEPRKFNFKPLTHYEIGEKLNILDFERGAKIAGSGFTLYNGKAALLERALINFMLDLHRENGYEEKWLPFLINGESLLGTGHLPKFEEDLYRINGENLYLNPTAEAPLTNIYRGEILKESDLPIWITAFAPSFRKEAGSYGKDTKGIIRQHQFSKVELVKLCKPEDSEKEHQSMLGEAEKVLQLLELPYRVVVLARGDMGFSAGKCYDIEVWLPGHGGYKEISSVSNCLDFQARRANIKFRREDTGKTDYVHTLNGSGLAVGRTVVAILENYQQEDGSVVIPSILQKYMNLTKIDRS